MVWQPFYTLKRHFLVKIDCWLIVSFCLQVNSSAGWNIRSIFYNPLKQRRSCTWEEAQITLPIILPRTATKLNCEKSSYQFQDFYMLATLPALKHRLKFDLIWLSHVQPYYSLSTTIIFMGKKNSQLSAKISSFQSKHLYFEHIKVKNGRLIK